MTLRAVHRILNPQAVLELITKIPSGAGPSGAGEDDAQLVARLQAGDPAATRALFDRYGGHVRAVLLRVLGPDPDLADLLHDVFVRAIEGVPRLRHNSALKAWLSQVAVFTARTLILRRRRRRRWLAVFAWDEPEAMAPPDPDASDALRATCALLERMPVEERLALSLRLLGQFEIAEVAEACGISLSTAKRRLRRASERFAEAARAHPSLMERLQERSE